MEREFVCVAKCPELDCDKSSHCRDTLKGIQEREERLGNYCPCGNNELWEEITVNK